MTIGGMPIPRAAGWSHSFRVGGSQKNQKDKNYGSMTWSVEFAISEAGITTPSLIMKQPVFQRTEIVCVDGIEAIMRVSADLDTFLHEWQRETGSLP